MFDTHYDLLTKLYICYKKNDFTYIENWVKNYNFDNVTGLIANLCFMSLEEMRNEYDIDYYHEGDSVIEIFRICMELLHKYIPSNIMVITSIEGCDYLKDENDLYALKELGLDSILPVWNCQNKFASGNRSDMGLTKAGEKLIDKACELGINIDLSHANEKSFWDIVNYIKNNNLKAKVYASHSNVKSLCDVSRNLTDDEIKAIADLGGFVGIMSNSGFVDKGGYQRREELNGTADYDNYIEYLKEKYLKHILYMHRLIGDVNHIALCTDDMGFCELDDYRECPIYHYETIASELRRSLRKYYSEEDINKLMYENAVNYLTKSHEKGIIK